MQKLLSDLKYNQVAKVIKLNEACQGFERFRLLDLGVVPGTEIRLALDNPLNDPVGYWIRGAVIALRKEQSNKIFVEIFDE
ncbi:MAG: FeoA family protein [Cyclobacteriaceae bacterium]|jgi:Fe2+ transport system protein FeoA